MNNNQILAFTHLGLILFSNALMGAELANATLTVPLSEEIHQSINDNSVSYDLSAKPLAKINPGTKSDLLNDIATKYIDIGQIEKAKVILAESLSIAQTIADGYEKRRLLRDLAVLLVYVEETDQAIQLYQNSLDRDSQYYALVGIVTALAVTGKSDQALELAETINNEVSRAPILYQIALSLAKSGNIEQSVEIIPNLPPQPPDLFTRYSQMLPDAWETMVKDLIAKDKYNEAFQFAQHIPDEQLRKSILVNSVLNEIFKLAHAGKIEEVFQIAQNISNESDRASVLSGIVFGLVYLASLEKKGEQVRLGIEINEVNLGFEFTAPSRISKQAISIAQKIPNKNLNSLGLINKSLNAIK